MTQKNTTVGDLLYGAYANLAMAHAANTDDATEYNKKHFIIRSKLLKGLKNGSMDIRSFFDDERLKMILPQSCCYCGATEHLAADHIIPRKKGGLDIGENLIWACRSCNSSKSATDMLEWLQANSLFPSILLYRRYLKILITYCRTHNIIDTSIKHVLKNRLPFNLSSIPQDYLPLASMSLWVTDIKEKKETMQKQSTYRLANWNLERPLKKTEKLRLALQKIKEINPDICVLTETSQFADLGEDYYSIHTEEYTDLPNEHWATIWSKWPIKKTIPTFDSHRTICALINAPFGELIVYATIIPYHNAGVIDGGKYAYTQRKYNPWEMHKENILLQGADWLKISSEHRDIPLIVAGDFNQTRDKQKYGYGTKITRELLSTVLATCNLSCITEENFGENGKLQKDPKKGAVRKNIDHICIPTDWGKKLNNKYIGAWDHFLADGTYMTDHNGVYLEFTL